MLIELGLRILKILFSSPLVGEDARRACPVLDAGTGKGRERSDAYFGFFSLVILMAIHY